MSLAYFPLYADDFEADTAHLTLAEDGAYNRLLRLCWRTPGCSIPADRDWIYRRMRAHTDEDKAVVDIVLDEFFTTEQGRSSNARLTKEYHAANEAHEKRKNAGKKGGQAKALKTKETSSSKAKAMPKQPEPEPEPVLREDTNVSSLALAKPLDEIAEAVNLYNAAATESGWPKVTVLSKARRSALAARLRDAGGLSGWDAALSKAQASDWCCGQNDRGWVANFDFLTKQSSFSKLMEGNYDNRSGNPRRAGSRSSSGVADAFAAVAGRMSAQHH